MTARTTRQPVKRQQQPRTRLRLHAAEEGSETDEEVVVSSGVAIAAAEDHTAGSSDEPGDDMGNTTGSGDGRPIGDGGSGSGGRSGSDRRGVGGARRPVVASNQEEHEDELEQMEWWDALTPIQQRAMMRRFIVQPPTPTAAQQPIVIQTPVTDYHRRTKMKMLHLEDFRGTSGESVEAWLAAIPQEVERQTCLGGDTWTAEELCYGATAHLKGDASKWLITLTENMHNEDKNLAYLVKMMRMKYGRCDNLFKIQQRLAALVQQPGEHLSDFAASLNNIGFGKRVTMEYYIEAFINGISNQTAVIQVRAYEQQTLDEAVQFAEDKCEEFGEGYKVTDWRVAKRRYRDDRDGEEDDAQPARKKTAVAEISGALDWENLDWDLEEIVASHPVLARKGK
ncbi:unnamed protein product [Phytophthora fragariaefolia]|uniref:Unnamed protein product n=1 Tax=Phytophthora fragariaefolia TaxID=1490495 RepID=A0A9W6TRA2_9STRA|nr:unnamed protein product [Phytophthora fragariaefolia]